MDKVNDCSQHKKEMLVAECPFCEQDGCCFCDYSGRVKIGDVDCFFKTVQDYNDAVFVIKNSYTYRYLNGNNINPLKLFMEDKK